MTDLTEREISVADLDAIMALSQACDIADTGQVVMEAVDVATDLSHDSARAWGLAAPDGSLQAVAYLVADPELPSQTAEFLVHPDQPVEIGAPLVDRLLAATAADPAGRKLHVMVGDGTAKSRYLLDRGARIVRHFFMMEMALDEPVPAPSWPANAVLSAVTDVDTELQPVFTVISEAFEDHWEHRSTEWSDWQARHRSRSDFDPSLWWLVRVDGEPAAATICMTRDSGGFVGAIGVRRQFRGTGLARQLLMVAFTEFQRRGLTSASLYVDGENPTGAVRLYEAVGMHVAARWDCHEFAGVT